MNNNNEDKITLSSPNYLDLSKYCFDNFAQLTDYHNLDNFENELEGYLGENRFVVCLNSGTSAIHLSLILAGVSNKDEVICQSLTFAASAFPIMYLNATPIFIDSEKDTWNMCPIHLENAIKDRILKGKKPKAIIVVHLYGMPAKMDRIAEIAKKYDVNLIEDAAEALGSGYYGKKCGSFGKFGIISFNNNKIITTLGGGALVCKKEEDKQKAIFLATQARDNELHYEHSYIGYNYRMNNIAAGIGSYQMKALEKHIELRRENNLFYQELFKNIDGVTVHSEFNSDYYSNHWLTTIIIDENKSKFSREDLRLQLLEDNIESRPLWKPMHLQPIFKDCEYYGDLVSEELFKNGLCLPSGSNLTDRDRIRIKKSIKKILK